MPKKNQFNILTYKKALDFSYSFYQSKFRKGIKFPYFTYLSSVSNLVIENNGKVTSNCDLQNSSTCDSSSNS